MAMVGMIPRIRANINDVPPGPSERALVMMATKYSMCPTRYVSATAEPHLLPNRFHRRRIDTGVCQLF
jgi:hypothetical protein